MRGAVTIAVVAALFMTGAADAQEHGTDLEIGSNLVRRQTAVVRHDDTFSVQAAHQMATCLANKRSSLAARYVDATTGPELRAASNGLFRDIDCNQMTGGSHLADQTSVHSPVDIERGMLAEALLAQMHGHGVPPALPPVRDYTSPYLAASERNPAVELMAVCVADTNPSGVDRLLQTVPQGPDEAAAVGALRPTLGNCLVANTTMTANRQSLRAALAEALYHRMTTPDVAPAVAK